ncbi:hypothetical protein CALVIDRAFT_541702 [Calocera viscosa TUFC12733]|uniref:Extracellular membrane protein CFEM domain-containing protein n=1 Tax=Calocera viscosa (strain TUFC12733) TaxID=1330018 RepID=A0A167HIA6_CALVF|nr:hypothetical protein CALVIDRAFT_541702 [Calocera viscosa TUFC12733]
MKFLSALVCALTFLIAGANAIPGFLDFFNNFETTVRRSMTITFSEGRYKRGQGLLPFTLEHVTVLKRQSLCSSNCNSTSDSSILQNSIANATCALDTGCVCNAVSQLSTGCEECILDSLGYSISSYQTACQAATSVIAVGTAVASAEEAVASGTGSCVSQCGNETELAGLDAVVGCGNNALCICSATNITSDSALTEGCLSCLLQQAGTTVSGFQSLCNAALASGGVSSSGASSTSGASSASGGSATTATGSASATSPSSPATTSAKSAAVKADRMYKAEAVCLFVLATTFFWLT